MNSRHDWAERVTDRLAFSVTVDRFLSAFIAVQRWLFRWVLPILLLIVILAQLFLTPAPDSATGMAVADVHAAEMEIDP